MLGGHLPAQSSRRKTGSSLKCIAEQDTTVNIVCSPQGQCTTPAASQSHLHVLKKYLGTEGGWGRVQQAPQSPLEAGPSTPCRPKNSTGQPPVVL